MAKENLDIADKEFHEAINFANSSESENPNNLAMKLKVNIQIFKSCDSRL